MLGLFVKVRLEIGKFCVQVLVVDYFIGIDQGRCYVLVVDEGNKIQYWLVEFGLMVDGLWVVCQGLQLGECIVVKGLVWLDMQIILCFVEIDGMFVDLLKIVGVV